jgi:hypothetical protein
MSDTLTSLDKTLSVLIDNATEKGPKLIEWLYQQSPELVNQLLLWHGVSSLVQFIICLSVIIAVPIGIYKGFSSIWNSDDEDVVIVGIIGSLVASGMWVAASVNINLTWLQIYIAPKLYMLEYVANLVK